MYGDKSSENKFDVSTECYFWYFECMNVIGIILQQPQHYLSYDYKLFIFCRNYWKICHNLLQVELRTKVILLHTRQPASLSWCLEAQAQIFIAVRQLRVYWFRAPSFRGKLVIFYNCFWLSSEQS
jgi:hypothetical protein